MTDDSLTAAPTGNRLPDQRSPRTGDAVDRWCTDHRDVSDAERPDEVDGADPGPHSARDAWRSLVDAWKRLPRKRKTQIWAGTIITVLLVLAATVAVPLPAACCTVVSAATSNEGSVVSSAIWRGML